MKTMAIRLEEEQHAQLSMIAKLEELTVADAIRQAIDQWIQERRSNPQLKARAQAVLAAIEQEASTRKGAIAALLSDERPAAAQGPQPRGKSGGRTPPKRGEGAPG